VVPSLSTKVGGAKASNASSAYKAKAADPTEIRTAASRERFIDGSGFGR
jgi:hypothetical protein